MLTEIFQVQAFFVHMEKEERENPRPNSGSESHTIYLHFFPSMFSFLLFPIKSFFSFHPSIYISFLPPHSLFLFSSFSRTIIFFLPSFFLSSSFSPIQSFCSLPSLQDYGPHQAVFRAHIWLCTAGSSWKCSSVVPEIKLDSA